MKINASQARHFYTAIEQIRPEFIWREELMVETDKKQALSISLRWNFSLEGESFLKLIKNRLSIFREHEQFDWSAFTSESFLKCLKDN